MRRLAAVSALLLPLAGPAWAQQQTRDPQRPLLEAGVFLGGGLLPDYPAASHAEWRGLALPWFIYRGEVLRADDRGLRGRFFRSGDLELTVNANGALGSRANDSSARRGMPDIDPLGEIGPALRWVAWRGAANTGRLVLEVPVRAAFSTDFSRIRYRGIVLAPELAYEGLGWGLAGSRARIGIGPVFASGGLMDYWYRVKPSDARPGRPAYDAEGGYLGMRLQFSYRVPVTKSITLTAGGRLENFSGATNAGSPLFRSNFNASLIAGVSFALYQSPEMVASDASPFD
ncbi:MipA/OmpV family protein [Siccirubricoccus sp. KC 17139]|uniref:MipA/OmpV family protein n=1 Tax=Siccirubricoccus soli TaxID=2899147 RepID=A0ABT1D7U1_9PROT|nr:MipA/OmpV family protein [Siccirubricoccus soli]MCO6417997.1 MipA/OmpV family protein [Siccirubricoccus soli]MCP2684132.1 MipA/OmpV family protein [Siccirubricoccus soli]